MTYKNIVIEGKISFILPVFNVAPYIEKCLDSIERQSYSNWEAILVDDGSTDASSEICQGYEKKNRKFRYVRQDNQGQGKARNLGISMAQGEFIGFIDPDDWIEPTLASDLIRLIEQGGYDFVNFGIDFVSVSGRVVRKFCQFEATQLEGGEIFRRAMVDKDILSSSCNKIYRTNFLREKGIYFPVLRSYEDLYFSRLLALNSRKCGFSRGIYYHALIREGSTTRGMNIDKVAQALELLKLERVKFVDVCVGGDGENLFRAHALKFSTQIIIQYAFAMKAWADYVAGHKLMIGSAVMNFPVNKNVLHYLPQKNRWMARVGRRPWLAWVIAKFLGAIGIRPY